MVYPASSTSVASGCAITILMTQQNIHCVCLEEKGDWKERTFSALFISNQVTVNLRLKLSVPLKDTTEVVSERTLGGSISLAAKKQSRTFFLLFLGGSSRINTTFNLNSLTDVSSLLCSDINSETNKIIFLSVVNVFVYFSFIL